MRQREEVTGALLRLLAPRRPLHKKAGLWGPRCVSFAIPVQDGDRVLVVGEQPGVTRAVTSAGAVCVSALPVSRVGKSDLLEGEVVGLADGMRLPMGDADVDHVHVPVLTDALAALFPQELARVLRPGGTLFVGVLSRAHARQRRAAWSLADARRLLEGAGMADIRAYGIRQSLLQPRYLVPLDAPEALRWYIEAACLPQSRYDVLFTRALRALRSSKLGVHLFAAYAFTAVRNAPPA